MNGNLPKDITALYDSHRFPLKKISNLRENNLPLGLLGIDDADVRFLFDKNFVVSVNDDSWSVTLPMRYHKIDSLSWWKFSHSIHNMKETSIPANYTDYGFIVQGGSTDDFLQWVRLLNTTGGREYNSYRQAVLLSYYYGNINLLTEAPIIPVITNPYRWYIKMVSPLGIIKTGERKNPHFDSINRHYITEFYIDGIAPHLNDHERQIVQSHDSNMWIDGNDVGMKFRHGDGRTALNLATVFNKLLLCNMPKGGLFIFSQGDEDIRGESEIIFPKYKNNKAVEDLSLPQNAGKGALR